MLVLCAMPLSQYHPKFISWSYDLGVGISTRALGGTNQPLYLLRVTSGFTKLPGSLCPPSPISTELSGHNWAYICIPAFTMPTFQARPWPFKDAELLIPPKLPTTLSLHSLSFLLPPPPWGCVGSASLLSAHFPAASLIRVLAYKACSSHQLPGVCGALVWLCGPGGHQVTPVSVLVLYQPCRTRLRLSTLSSMSTLLRPQSPL